MFPLHDTEKLKILGSEWYTIKNYFKHQPIGMIIAFSEWLKQVSLNCQNGNEYMQFASYQTLIGNDNNNWRSNIIMCQPNIEKWQHNNKREPAKYVLGMIKNSCIVSILHPLVCWDFVFSS